MIKISGVKFSAGRVEFDVVTQTTAVESFDFLLGFDPEEVDLAAVTVTGPAGWSVIPNVGGPGELLIGGFSSNFTPVAAGGLLLKASLGLKVASDTSLAMTLEGSFNDPAVIVPTTTTTLQVEQGPSNQTPTGDVTIIVPTGPVPLQGQELAASNTLADLDGLGPITYTWKAGGATVGTGISYTLQQADVGKAVTVTASYTDGGGTAESVASVATAAVANVNDLPTGSVTIVGTPTQGQTLSAANTLTDLDGLGPITYTWKSGGANVGTGVSYTLQQADVGKAVTVTASYTDGGGAAESVTSLATNVVLGPSDPGSGGSNFQISGVKFSAGRVEFDVATQAVAVESFDFLLRFDPEEVNLAAVTVTGPAGWSVIPNTGGPGELLIGGFSSNFTPVAAGGLLLKVSLVLKVASDTNVAMTLEGSFNDPAVSVYPETVTLASSPATELDVQVLAWKTSEPLPGTLIEVQGGTLATTASDGLATLSTPTPGSISLQVSRPVESAEAPATSAAVTLQDAVSILKMIAGQSLNGDGVSTPRAQSVAADFDGSGTVSLADAIGVLRHAVGLPAAAPAWVFIEEGGGTGQSVLNPGIPGPIALEVSSPGLNEVNLIGVLRGDVDGSFTPNAYGVYLD